MMTKNQIRQSGQTLIETIVAIFILTTALSAGLALTIYTLSHSDQTQKEIVATNLAREGIDVIKNMRDTNWLESDAKGGSYDLDTSPSSTNCKIGTKVFACYPKVWEGASGSGLHNYDLSKQDSSGNPTFASSNYRLEFTDSSNTWKLANSSNYALYRQLNGDYTHSPATGTSEYARKINIAYNTAAPFGPGDLSELIVTSTVSWAGRGCVNVTSDPATTNCSVSVTEKLTNWKDYK